MRTRLATLAVVTLLAGCGGGGGEPTALVSPFGDYVLTTVNGARAPAVAYQEPGHVIEMLGGLITLRSDGTFTAVYEYQNTYGDVQYPSYWTACDGSWTHSSGRLTLAETPAASCSDTATADWDGLKTLTVNWKKLGIPLVHRR